MKLKERLRIAWQVLTKGTCRELDNAIERHELSEKRMLHCAEQFQFAVKTIQPSRPRCFINVGNGYIDEIKLPHLEVPVVVSDINTPTHARLEADIYRLEYIEARTGFMSSAERNADKIEWIKLEAAKSIAKTLIEKGIIHMDEEFHHNDYYSKRFKFWVPMYRIDR